MKKTVHDLDGELLELDARISAASTEAQKLLDRAALEERDFETNEQQAFERHIANIDSIRVDRIAVENELRTAAKLRERMLKEANNHVNKTQSLNPVGGVRIDDSYPERRKMSTHHKLGAGNYQHRIGQLKAFSGEDAARDAFSCGQWLKASLARWTGGRHEHAEDYCNQLGGSFMTATEGTPTTGGYLVPTPLENAIINVRNIAGVSRRAARIVPMTAETLSVAKKTAGPTVTYPGEAQTISDSDQTWGEVQLTAKKRAILSKVSQELNDDAIIPVMDDLASQMGTEFAVQEDNEFINSDGTSTYGNENGLLDQLGTAGIFTPANGGGKEVWSGLAMSDFTDSMAKLPDKYTPYQLAWICSTNFYFSVMMRIMATAGGNTSQLIEQGASNMPMFLGYPVYTTNQMPTATAISTVSVLFGAFSQAAMIGDRTGIQVKPSEHAFFTEDVIALRATTRYDINVHDSGDSSNAGAYVALKTAAS